MEVFEGIGSRNNRVKSRGIELYMCKRFILEICCPWLYKETVIDFYPGLIIQTTVPAKSLDNQLSKVMFTKIVVFLFKHYQNGKIFLLNVTMWQGRSQERACPTTSPTHKHTHTQKSIFSGSVLAIWCVCDFFSWPMHIPLAGNISDQSVDHNIQRFLY